MKLNTPFKIALTIDHPAYIPMVILNIFFKLVSNVDGVFFFIIMIFFIYYIKEVLICF